MNNVSLIIVHWNTPELLRKQLAAIYSSSERSESRSKKFSTSSNDNNPEIIVVDNASNESLSWVKKEFPQVKLIENKKNVGYATACNQGVQMSKGPAPRSSKSEVGEWLLFINPDVELTPASVNQLVNTAQKKKFDACSPRSSSPGYQKPLPTPLSLLVEFTPLKFLASPLARLGMMRGDKTLFGGCLLIKKKVLDRLGGWDERFFLWFEDSDLTIRLKKAGYSIGFLSISIPHSGGASFGLLTDEQRKKIFFDSMNIFANKHFSSIGRSIVRLIRLQYTV